MGYSTAMYTSTLVLLLYLATFSQEDKVNSCIACTSEDGSNTDCEGTLEPESQPNVECSTEFGNDYCYVLVTKQKQPTQMWMWNRGCCTPKAGSQICPLSEPDHVINDVYEMWRARCDTDDCNLMDPRTNAGGGGNNDGGLVVHGRSGARGVSGDIVFIVLNLIAIKLCQESQEGIRHRGRGGGAPPLTTRGSLC